jgi:hypothetical protein
MIDGFDSLTQLEEYTPSKSADRWTLGVLLYQREQNLPNDVNEARLLANLEGVLILIPRPIPFATYVRDYGRGKLVSAEGEVRLGYSQTRSLGAFRKDGIDS